MLSSELTESELEVFTLIERIVSVFSLLGCVFIIATFAASKSFHKPINRLVFYASIGNMMTNVATLMARSYIAYGDSAACQFQAFLIQMFMPADAFWTLAMAVNVYLTFYYKYDAQMLRKMEIPYLACCYGIPFVVALTYIFINDPTKGRMYGNATLWCWVQQTWDVWRIITFYGPVWVVIFVTFFIYIRAGREIYLKHKQLKDLNYTSHYDPEPLPMNDPFSVKTTEVSVSFSDAQEAIDLSPLGGSMNRHHSISGQSVKANYSVTISAKPPMPPIPAATTSQPTTPTTPTFNIRSSRLVAPSPSQTQDQQQQSSTSSGNHSKPFSRRKANYDAHNAAWSYTKCALLFFTAMLVTWIPSSANRVYSVVKNGEVALPLEYMSAFVLPLQGFWNALIYMTTSWKACKLLWEDVTTSLKGGAASTDSTNSPSDLTKPVHLRSPSRLQRFTGRGDMGSGLAGPSSRAGHFHRSSKSSETESMEELANVTRSGTSSP